MARKVVEGGPIRFKEDLPIALAEVGSPLGLPPLAPFPEPLTVRYKGRWFELTRLELTRLELTRPEPTRSGAGEDRARIWRRSYGLAEVEPAAAREERWKAEHRSAIEAAGRAWLDRVLPGCADAPGAQLLRALREKVEELCPLPVQLPRPDVGRGQITWRSEPAPGSALGGLQGHERSLQLDGKVYELLSLGEYLARFERAFAPELYATLQRACESASPAELCAQMGANLERIDKKSYGVIKGKVHHDERTFELRLDGVYFVPEYLAATSTLLEEYRVRLERALKLSLLDQLSTRGG